MENPQMRAYHFTMRGAAGISEELGSHQLDDDADAVSFGLQVVRDLMQVKPEEYAGSVLAITDQARTVGVVPCKVGVRAARPGTKPGPNNQG
jgi:hypothetical protein